MPRMARSEFTCSVRVQYLPEQSQPSEGKYAFAYTVTIVNSGDITAQLVARQWLITDAHGREEEVRGLAVVGHQPLLKPGESFEYTSGTRLETPHGQMRGTFYCMTELAHSFETKVSEFQLVYPGLVH